MFNNLRTNLTVFNIEESNFLKSKYSKIQYRHFKEKMNASKMKFINMTQRILKPIENELGEIFDDFQLIKEKKNVKLVN